MGDFVFSKGKLGSEAQILDKSLVFFFCFKVKALKTLTSLNKEVRLFFLGDNSIWSFHSVSSLSDYSIWRS